MFRMTPPPLSHVRHCHVHAVVVALDVDADEPVEVRFGSAFDGADMRNTCVVDQNVDARASSQLRESFSDPILIGDITSIGGGVAAGRDNLLASCCGRLLIQLEHMYGRALPGEAHGNRLANAASRAGDHGDFAV